MENYAGSLDELLEQARQVAKTPESAALLLAAVNKRLAEIVPGAEPVPAAKRLTAEWDDWAIEAGHRYLNEHYEESLDPGHFSVSYEDIDHEELMGLAEEMLRVLRGGIACPFSGRVCSRRRNPPTCVRLGRYRHAYVGDHVPHLIPCCLADSSHFRQRRLPIWRAYTLRTYSVGVT